MKVVYHKDFEQAYTGDPAAASGRMAAIIKTIEAQVEFVTAEPAARRQIAAVHTEMHIRQVENRGVYEIAALAAGGAVRTAMCEPSFGLVRPPGHHASLSSAWGFCYFNNMAVALEALWRQQKAR